MTLEEGSAHTACRVASLETVPTTHQTGMVAAFYVTSFVLIVVAVWLSSDKKSKWFLEGCTTAQSVHATQGASRCVICRCLPATVVQCPDAVLTDISHQCQEARRCGSITKQWHDVLRNCQVQAGASASHTAELRQTANAMHQKHQSGAQHLQCSQSSYPCCDCSHVFACKVPQPLVVLS